MAERALDRVVAALGDRVRRRRGDDHVGALCPAHDDRNPTLSVDQGAKGAVLKCFSGCPVEAIVAALNLTMADLFDTPLPKKRRGGGGVNPSRNTATAQHPPPAAPSPPTPKPSGSRLRS